MFRLIASRQFESRLEKFKRAHVELRRRIAQVLRDLEADPFQPHLRLHPLKGELGGLFAVGVAYRYRITLMLSIQEQEIVLLDTGTRDEVYR